MSDQLFLPTELSNASNKFVIFDCTRLFGEVFGEFCDQKMKAIEGPDWLKQIRDLRKIYKINLIDPTFLLKECLATDSRIRKVLPNSERFYNKLYNLKKLRNESLHFSFKADTIQMKPAVELYFEVCMDLNLQFGIDQYSILMKRLHDLEAGKIFSTDVNISHKLSETEKQKADMEDQLIETSFILLQKEEELNKVQEIIVKNNLKTQELINLNEQKTSAYNEANKDLYKSKREAEELRVQVSELKTQKEYDSIAEKEIEKIIESLAGTISMINADSPKKQSRKAKLKNPLPEVGTIWNKPKGKKKITLSVGKRDLVDSKTSKPLDYIPEESRMEIAEDWLRVRPTGGRVFVDDESNAATLIGEDLVYLGNISDFLD